MIQPQRVLGLREAIDRALRDVVAVAPGEQVVALVVGGLIANGNGAKRRCAWRWQIVQLETLAATRAQLAADGGRVLAQIGLEGADA